MGKNIVLLSDGTGNAASSPFKTNVWRLYQALDIGPAENGAASQIALYDNGVGTETFKPLAILGLAIGLGVATNVKNLYTFLCRNYCPGDKIYLIGFSRGAFTVRILAGLILRCGLVTAPDDAELNHRVKAAYAEYKRDVARRATETRPLLLGWLLGGARKGKDTDHIKFGFKQHRPDIEFIGVWDTVDAYGMPVDELKEGIDRWIWPMTLADRKLSDRVHRACQALSIDDERPTFRPVLWTEPQFKPERLTQVWFPGVHANVGGGYPDDGLACAALQWMMDEAERRGLRFYEARRREYDSLANPQGQQYDSRSGLAGYYRYGPRNMDALCADLDHGVRVNKLLVHDDALSRIGRHQVAYAPVNFTTVSSGYVRVGRSFGSLALQVMDPLETPKDIASRAEAMESTLDAVFRRRVAYLTTVFSTIVLAVMPLSDWMLDHTRAARWFAEPIAAMGRVGDIATALPVCGWLTGLIASGLHWILGLGAVPSWAAWWIESFARHPAAATFFAAMTGWLFVRKSALLQDEIAARSEYAWCHVRQGAAHDHPPDRRWTDGVVRTLRTNRPLVAIYGHLTKQAVPFLFALLVALPIGLGLVAFFLPKFHRNFRRRHRYKVELKKMS